MNKKIAIISAILENPAKCQAEFNNVVSGYSDIILGRMGLPLKDKGVSVISITLLGDMDRINALTGKIGKIEHVTVKTAVSKKEII
ncbi:hypothetical protein HMPREF3188_01332 [Tissierellia bacterium KA00581]|nr:hypothetical protein HMPREF3188_01332 [Tissierellia bacterium KA00581]